MGLFVAHSLAAEGRLAPPRDTSWRGADCGEEGGPRGKHGFPRDVRRGRDLNPRRTFQHVRDFQSRSLDRSDTSPRPRQSIRGRAGWLSRADTEPKHGLGH